MFKHFKCRIPTVISPQASKSLHAEENLPTSHEFLHQWYMVASSSSFWKDHKRCVSITCKASSQSNALPGSLDDLAAYGTDGSSKQSSTRGTSSPCTSEPGVYYWRGAGFLRLISIRWGIVGYGRINNTGPAVLVSNILSSLNTSYAIQNREG